MTKITSLTVAAILYANPTFACSLGISPVSGFDPAHYVFIGEIVELVKDVPYSSGGLDEYALGFRIRVKELIHPPRPTKRPLYYDVFPLRLTSWCSLASEVTELRTRFPVGSEVRVVAKVATVLTERPAVGGPLRLETSIYNRGGFARNDVRTDLRSSATSVYDYGTWVHPETTATDRALIESAYDLLQFELRKDLLRLQNARRQTDRIAILERLSFYPNVRDLDLPAIARKAKAQETLGRLQQVWAERIRRIEESNRRPPPRPDPVLERPELKDLLTHLKGRWPEASETTRRLLTYLESRPEGEDPLVALISWLTVGFPELRDTKGHWNVSPDGVKADFARSLAHFLQRLPAELRPARYLEVYESVRTDDHIAIMLAQGAGRYLRAEDLKTLSFELMHASDASRRRHGAVMVCRQSETDEVIWSQCTDALVTDADYGVRFTVLHSFPPEQQLSPPRREALTTLKLQVFLTDPNTQMRDAAARHVRSYAETAASLKYAEAPRMLARFLVELVQARDAVVQETLAGFAAGMTTRWPYSPKTRIPRDALALFLTTVEGQRAGRPGAEPLLAQLWLDWWQLVMREHSLGPGYR